MQPLRPLSDGMFDFRDATGFAAAYLNTYYCGEPPIDERIVSRFLVREAPRLRGGRFAEIGCGPTVHHLLPIAPYVDELHLLDYLPDNLAAVRAWQQRRPEAHDWREFTKLALADAGLPHGDAEIAAREDLVRQRIAQLAACDLRQPTPRHEFGTFDAVGCFYCAEEVGITLAAWQTVMARVAERVAPGGRLLMAALAGMTSYRVEDQAGGVRWLPCAPVTAGAVRELLPRLGFASAELCIETHEIAAPDVGVTAVLLAAATRTELG